MKKVWAIALYFMLSNGTRNLIQTHKQKHSAQSTNYALKCTPLTVLIFFSKVKNFLSSCATCYCTNQIEALGLRGSTYR